MTNSPYSSSFHIISSLSTSPTSFEVILYFIYNSFIWLNLCHLCTCIWIMFIEFCRIINWDRVQMSKIFHQWKNVASSYQEKVTACKCLMKMGNLFTLPIVTCRFPVTCNVGQWYYTVNGISFMTCQWYVVFKNVKGWRRTLDVSHFPIILMIDYPNFMV